MSEEIVACPGCAKKFRIPEGAPPGAFPCTACGVSVPYGAPAAAAKGGSKAAARPAAKAAAPAARAAAPARRAPAAPTRGRRAAEDDGPPKKSYQGLIWGGIVVLGGGLVGVVYVMTKPEPPPPAPPVVAPPVTAAKPPEPTKTTPQVAPKPVEQPKPGEQPKPAVDGAAAATPDAPKPSDAPATKPDAPPPTKPAATKFDYATLGQTFASVAGVTEEERANMDKWVALAIDQSSARDGAEAEGKLIKAGKKAIPSILSGFSKQFNGAKWAADSDQWSADKLQDLLHRITGADGLNPDYWPRFMSGESSDAFQKAATMWITWWNGKGQLKDKYKARND